MKKRKSKRNISKEDSRKRRRNKALGILITVLIIPLIIGYIFYWLPKKDAEKSYWLEDTLYKKQVNPTEIFIVQIGQIKVRVSYNDLINGINLRKWVDIGYDYPINIKIENGKLLVTADFNDKSGRLIARIADNQWKINRYNYCDRNFSQDALEVVDKNKAPLLQVDIKNGNNIFIGGVFYFPTIRLFMSNGNSMITGDPTFNDAIALKKMKRIFKYPSKKYFGVKDVDTKNISFKS